MDKIKRYPQIVIGILVAALLICFLISVNIGSLHVTPLQLFKGLWIEYDATVASIYQIRFPRVIVSMICGGALALSGLLLQTVLKNPLADPGIIGVSQGASLVSTLVMLCLPELYFFSPIFAFIGGIFTFIFIYFLSWKSGFNTTHILLIGVAVNYTLGALLSFISSFQTLTSEATGSLTFMTWNEASTLIVYLLPLMFLTLFLSKPCHLLGLEDKTLLSLGIHVNAYRLALSFLAVLLCSISVAVVGVISFVGLLVPHMARILVGYRYRYLLLTSLLLGSFLLLLADTLGRVLIQPYEISAAIIMAIVGGPVFIILLKRGMKNV